MRTPGRRRLRRAVAGGAVLAVSCGGYAAYGAVEGSAPAYRTASVTVADVDRTLTLSGTVSPSGRRDLAFGTSGTVASVRVASGEKVRRGQVLAVLEQRSLRTALVKARADLAAARAQLESDEDAQASTVSTASVSSSNASTGTSTGSASSSSTSQGATNSQNGASGGDSGPGASTQQALAHLHALQDGVTSAQSKATAAITTAKAALAAQVQACAVQETTASASASADAGADPSADPSTSSSAQVDDATAACDAALDVVQQAQDDVADAQDALASALTDLGAALGTAADQLAQTGTDVPAATSQGSTSTSPTRSTTASSTASGSSAQGTTQTVSAASLARDQQAIDEARVSVITARQALAGSRIIAPSSGTVASVAVVEGGSASAADSSIVLVAKGTTTVTLAVSSTQLSQIEVGQVAEVTSAGATSAQAGAVTATSSVPDDEGTYPVTITLNRRGLAMPTGSTASVAIVIGTASQALTVPTSAVSDGVVEVLADGEVTRTRVTTGVVGATRTQITDGLEAGQRVVLADLDAALPDSDDSSTSSGFGAGGGGMGGMGGPPSGMSGSGGAPPSR